MDIPTCVSHVLLPAIVCHYVAPHSVDRALKLVVEVSAHNPSQIGEFSICLELRQLQRTLMGCVSQLHRTLMGSVSQLQGTPMRRLRNFQSCTMTCFGLGKCGAVARFSLSLTSAMIRLCLLQGGAHLPARNDDGNWDSREGAERRNASQVHRTHDAWQEALERTESRSAGRPGQLQVVTALP
ncbi:hypothetical protein ACIRU3_42180 [Streptomyces sp. NPDC101151]|uniref:hypothetical protein n=1 Tax=Streptomyces sp. NPDC101151 TaxID=3366115 RepID=UPI0037F77115